MQLEKSILAFIIYSWLDLDVYHIRILFEKQVKNNVFNILFDFLIIFYSCIFPIGFNIELSSSLKNKKFIYKVVYSKIIYELILKENIELLFKSVFIANIILFIQAFLFKNNFSNEMIFVLEKFDNFKITKKSNIFSLFLLGYMSLSASCYY